MENGKSYTVTFDSNGNHSVYDFTELCRALLPFDTMGLEQYYLEEEFNVYELGRS